MSDGPEPIPTPETLPYWEGALAGELRIQQCNACSEYYFYPRPYCPKCNSDDVEWRTVSGRATLRSYVINERPLPVFNSDAAQVIALVDLDEGPRMMTNIVGTDATRESLPLGLKLKVGFEPRGAWALPVFSPAKEA